MSSSSHAKKQSASQLQASPTVIGRYPSEKLVVGAGVAIFHVASARVCVVYDPTHSIWVLPKGRRDVHEATPRAGEREGYEESGYRNRLLPIPIVHRQPQPRMPLDPRLSKFHCEPVWTELMPASPTTQYILYWYIAETLPPDVEAELNQQEEDSPGSIFGKPYQYPPPYPLELRLKDRTDMEPKNYEPVKHTDTTNDAEEMLYESHLLPIEEARKKLGPGTQADVIRRGWEAIQLRLSMEI